jgi:nickel-dependent lactate racemase
VNTGLLYGDQVLQFEVPDNTKIYESSYKSPNDAAEDIVFKAIQHPINCLPLKKALKKRRSEYVVVVVSDMTRPIPYSKFLNLILHEIESAGVSRNSILILIATGMHRPSNQGERAEMFGSDICKNYQILDHSADKYEDLIELNTKSTSVNTVKLNRYFVQAGFRMITGLVEPQFMTGFSGGRKTICPGLVSLDTVTRFHGDAFLANPAARNGNLMNNPCHQESLSIAKMVEADFSLNIVLNKDRQIVNAFAGELEASHLAACKFVKKYACPTVDREYDIILTSSGGYPLDATFYQCIKGMVSCLPLVKINGIIISVGECREGIGSLEYKEIMFKYANKWQLFVNDIKNRQEVLKDQWQFQMHTRVLEKIGTDHLYFISHNLSKKEMAQLSISGIKTTENEIRREIEKLLSNALIEKKSMAVLPEGPYCAPIV